nr:MAG TPA: hypothetical protein [Caudoviricetes sp.]
MLNRPLVVSVPLIREVLNPGASFYFNGGVVVRDIL